MLASVAELAARVLDEAKINLDDYELDLLLSDLRDVITGSPVEALAAAADFAFDAAEMNPVRQALWRDSSFRDVLSTLAEHYVLFAVLASGGPARRILKYSYGEDFDLDVVSVDGRRGQILRDLGKRLWRPDRQRFAVSCPGASRAASFHVEVAIPEELRICRAVLLDSETEANLSGQDRDTNRASLYAADPLALHTSVITFVEIAAERTGQVIQAALTSWIAAILLGLGVLSGLDTTNPGAAVSIVLAGTALYSGFAAGTGHHKLVRTIFASRQRWLLVTTVAALTGSATLALEYPCASPVSVWAVAAALAIFAALRLTWSAVRSPP